MEPDLKRVDLRVSVALGLTSVVGSRCAQRPVRTAEPEPGVELDTREVVPARGDQFCRCRRGLCLQIGGCTKSRVAALIFRRLCG